MRDCEARQTIRSVAPGGMHWRERRRIGEACAWPSRMPRSRVDTRPAPPRCFISATTTAKGQCRLLWRLTAWRNPVYANTTEISSKSMGGKSICEFPDVCFTPPVTPATPPGVPIPYPNTGLAGDTTDGSKTVKIGNEEVMLKNKSVFKKSTGDEAGSRAKKGIITSTTKGAVYLHRVVDGREGRRRERRPQPRHDNAQSWLALRSANGSMPTVHVAGVAPPAGGQHWIPAGTGVTKRRKPYLSFTRRRRTPVQVRLASYYVGRTRGTVTADQLTTRASGDTIARTSAQLAGVCEQTRMLRVAERNRCTTSTCGKQNKR